jgi:hypothetical protein
MLEQAFGDFRDVRVIEEEREMREGTSHAGMSAVIGLTAISLSGYSPRIFFISARKPGAMSARAKA